MSAAAAAAAVIPISVTVEGMTATSQSTCLYTQYNGRGTAQARHLHVTVSQGLGGPYRSTSMHGTTYMHLAPLTVTDKQLQPLRINQQRASTQRCCNHSPSELLLLSTEHPARSNAPAHANAAAAAADCCPSQQLLQPPAPADCWSPTTQLLQPVAPAGSCFASRQLLQLLLLVAPPTAAAAGCPSRQLIAYHTAAAAAACCRSQSLAQLASHLTNPSRPRLQSKGMRDVNVAPANSLNPQP
jgi:hypothetical protein